MRPHPMPSSRGWQVPVPGFSGFHSLWRSPRQSGDAILPRGCGPVALDTTPGGYGSLLAVWDCLCPGGRHSHTQCTLRNRRILYKSRLVRMVCYTWRDVSSGCRTLWALSAWPVSTSSQPSSTEASKPSSSLMWPPVCTACSAQDTA